MALVPSSHGYGQCAYHIVLVPHYRHHVFLDARIKKRCEELLRAKAAREGYQVYELQVAPDHMHLFLGIGPTCSVSEAIRLLKCNSARELFREYPS
jgi:putative transposase